MWEAWDLFAPWRSLTFLDAAGFRGVSYGAVRDFMNRDASWMTLLFAAVAFFVCADGIIWVVRASTFDMDRAVRRTTMAMIAVMVLAVAVHAAFQIHAAADAGHQLAKLAKVTRSSVDDIADQAGVRVTILLNVDYGPATCRCLPLEDSGSAPATRSTATAPSTAHPSARRAVSSRTGGPR